MGILVVKFVDYVGEYVGCWGCICGRVMFYWVVCVEWKGVWVIVLNVDVWDVVWLCVLDVLG